MSVRAGGAAERAARRAHPGRFRRCADDAFPRHTRSGIGDGLPESPVLPTSSPFLLGTHVVVVQLKTGSLLRGDDVVRHVGDGVGSDDLVSALVRRAEAVADVVRGAAGEKGEDSSDLMGDLCPPFWSLREVAY